MHLFVFGEPNIVPECGTRNNALNEILEHYTKYNEAVTYVSFSHTPLEPYVHKGVNYYALTGYTKEKRFFLHKKSTLLIELKKLIKSSNDKCHFQFRLPSLFVLQIYFILKGFIKADDISFYLAGNWKESLKYNYPNKKYLSYTLPVIENIVLKNKKCVFAGDALLHIHSQRVKLGHAFYSTTHSKSDVKYSLNKEREKGICFIGRIEKLKNYKFIVELAKTSPCRHYTFYMLGDGPDTDILKDLIVSNRINNIVLCGHVGNRHDFDHLIDKCKYFILPSYTEGTSKTLPEMMCRNTIPLAFKHVGSNDYILNDHNGILVEVDDVNEAASTIELIDNDHELYCQFINSAFQYATLNTIENQLDKMFEFLYEK